MNTPVCVSASISPELRLHVQFSPKFIITYGRGSVFLRGIVIRHILLVLWVALG